jgi:hypothetical protein
MKKTTKKMGRPRLDPNLALSHGIMVQPRFPRSRFPELKAAAVAEGLPITVWIRRVVYLELDARKERKLNGNQ